MRKLIINILIVLLYCFPFVYFAMHLDFTNGSMLGYLLLIVGTSILAFFGKYFSNAVPIITGNIASVIISFYFLYKVESTLGVGWDAGYFNPVSPYQLLILVSLLNLIPQFVVMMLTDKITKRRLT